MVFCSVPLPFLRLLLDGTCFSVNTAGYLKPEPVDQLTEKNFEDHIAVNVKAPLFLTQAVIPHMSAGKGRRIQI